MDPAIVAMAIPIIALMIPIVVILTTHQRKMAEIIHRNNSTPSGDLDSIRQELQQLRMMMNQQTIAIDDVRSKQTNSSLPQPTSVQDRLGAS
jgi:hypothetical protein